VSPPVFVDEIIDHTPLAPQPREPKGFSGAAVFGNPATCYPCRLLDHDIQSLVEADGWTMSADPDVFADFMMLAPRARHGKIPVVEFYCNGQMISQRVGYVGQPDDPQRRQMLREIIAQFRRDCLADRPSAR